MIFLGLRYYKYVTRQPISILYIGKYNNEENYKGNGLNLNLKYLSMECMGECDDFWSNNENYDEDDDKIDCEYILTIGLGVVDIGKGKVRGYKSYLINKVTIRVKWIRIKGKEEGDEEDEGDRGNNVMEEEEGEIFSVGEGLKARVSVECQGDVREVRGGGGERGGVGLNIENLRNRLGDIHDRRYWSLGHDGGVFVYEEALEVRAESEEPRQRAYARCLMPLRFTTTIILTPPTTRRFAPRPALLRFEIPHVVNGEDLKLSQLFGTFTNAKEELGLQEYSLSQTSLEQIFNKFASTQEEETGNVGGGIK